MKIKFRRSAIRNSADKSVFENCRFLGYQDTMLIDAKSRQYFHNCFITGDTDFIYGNATAVFDHCTVESTDHGWVTAANTDVATPVGFVFLDCTLVKGEDRSPGDDHHPIEPHTVYLGRPWGWERGNVACVIYIRTKMDDHINAAGWDPWDHLPDNPNKQPERVTLIRNSAAWT